MSGTAEARIVTFCMQADCIKSWPTVTKHSKKGRGQSHVTRPFKLCPNHIFPIGKARHFKFRVLVDTEENECMHISLPKGMCSESRDLFKFWK